MADRVCVDASLAVKWVAPEVGRSEAWALWEQWQGAADIWAPDVLWIELANGLRHKVQEGVMTAEQVNRALAAMVATDIRTMPGRETSGEALRVALETGLTVWDASYIVVARCQAADLWTADREQQTKGLQAYPRIHLLEFPR